MREKVFSELVAPLRDFVSNCGSNIDEKSGSKTFFFIDFLQILVFGTSIGVPSMRKLIKELASNSAAHDLALPEVAYSTFRDGFTRFNILIFKELYTHVHQSCQWLEVSEFSCLGLLKAVDGSIFPTLRSMEWANYKKHFKALKLHLAFDLNTSCPNEFLITEGNYSERRFLITILKKGVTYICDRGYFSFDVLKEMNKVGAMFVLRLKEKVKFDSGISLKLTGHLPACFSQIKDDLVRFTNDEEQKVYRIVRFRVLNSYFVLCTNRLDLTTIQVIMLYAYRWQIELIFKFLKRSLKGLHLFAQTEKAAQVHFYMLLITALLQLRLKQLFLAEAQENTVKKQKSGIVNLTYINHREQYLGYVPDKWMNKVNEIFKNGFKISTDWLLYLKNYIAQTIDSQIVTDFNSA
jgi:Transposase DDE domain